MCEREREESERVVSCYTCVELRNYEYTSYSHCDDEMTMLVLLHHQRKEPFSTKASFRCVLRWYE